MIELSSISFSYGKRHILQDISFSAGDGEVVGILGTNGTGKSTLITCINRIRIPESGEVFIDGNPVSVLGRNRLAKLIAYVPQRSESAAISVFDSILLGRRPYMKWSASREDIAICQEMVHRMGLDMCQLRNLDELSGGEQQKVMLARALVQNPRVMLLDEPTSSLDPHNQHWIMSKIRQMADKTGMTVLVVLHDINLAMAYCDRFLFMKNGHGLKYCNLNEIDTSLIGEVYDVNAEITEIKGQRFIVIEKES